MLFQAKPIESGVKIGPASFSKAAENVQIVERGLQRHWDRQLIDLSAKLDNREVRNELDTIIRKFRRGSSSRTQVSGELENLIEKKIGAIPAAKREKIKREIKRVADGLTNADLIKQLRRSIGQFGVPEDLKGSIDRYPESVREKIRGDAIAYLNTVIPTAETWEPEIRGLARYLDTARRALGDGQKIARPTRESERDQWRIVSEQKEEEFRRIQGAYERRQEAVMGSRRGEFDTLRVRPRTSTEAGARPTNTQRGPRTDKKRELLKLIADLDSDILNRGIRVKPDYQKLRGNYDPEKGNYYNFTKRNGEAQAGFQREVEELRNALRAVYSGDALASAIKALQDDQAVTNQLSDSVAQLLSARVINLNQQIELNGVWRAELDLRRQAIQRDQEGRLIQNRAINERRPLTPQERRRLEVLAGEIQGLGAQSLVNERRIQTILNNAENLPERRDDAEKALATYRQASAEIGKRYGAGISRTNSKIAPLIEKLESLKRAYEGYQKDPNARNAFNILPGQDHGIDDWIEKLRNFGKVK